MLEIITNLDPITRGVIAFLVAIFGSLAIGNRLILKLISMKVGQPVRSKEEVRELYELHGQKAGTPTMGGIMIIAMMCLSVLLCSDWQNPYMHIILFVLVALGALGFKDDFAKITQGSSKGVSSKYKLIWQFGVALAAALLFYFQKDLYPDFFSTGNGDLTSSPVSAGTQEFMASLVSNSTIFDAITPSDIRVPFFNDPIHLGWLAIPFFVIIIVGSSNAVNLTDGLDGLASGCIVTTCTVYSLISFGGIQLLSDPVTAEVGVVLLSLVGATCGFLWFNAYPARVFMGDTGSLGIGGAIGVAAICTKNELILLIVGIVFVVEALSVMAQVAYFKYTKRRLGEGKRLLRCAPIHHHFELLGWKETQVITRFWIMSFVFGIIGFYLSTR